MKIWNWVTDPTVIVHGNFVEKRLEWEKNNSSSHWLLKTALLITHNQPNPQLPPTPIPPPPPKKKKKKRCPFSFLPFPFSLPVLPHPPPLEFQLHPKAYLGSLRMLFYDERWTYYQFLLPHSYTFLNWEWINLHCGVVKYILHMNYCVIGDRSKPFRAVQQQ